MIYPYSCANNECVHTWDVIKSVSHIDDAEYCHNCGSIGIRTISSSGYFYGASDWNTSHYNPALGCNVSSNKEARKIAKERGWVEVGNENPDKISKEYERDREKKFEARYNEICDTSLGEVK